MSENLKEVTDATAAVASVAAEAMWDSAVEGDTEEEEEALPKRSIIGAGLTVARVGKLLPSNNRPEEEQFLV
jgi:hypothetical protein